MDNVIQFPSKSKGPFPNSVEQSIEHVEEVRRSYCDEVTADIIEAAFSVMASYGIQLKPDELSVKSVVFLEEAARSMVYTSKGLNHSFQEIAEMAVTLDDGAKDELNRIAEETTLPT